MHLKDPESLGSPLTFICGVQIRLPSARVMNGCSKRAVAAAVHARAERDDFGPPEYLVRLGAGHTRLLVPHVLGNFILMAVVVQMLRT
jgi:hypothetical protein